MPPLHIKLGLVKQFVKALNKDGDAFQHIDALFPYLSDAKKKAGIFTGPQIRQMHRSEELTSKITVTEAAAWKTFRDVVENFLGNKHSSDYKILVNNLMEEYEKMGCRMPLKMHFLHSHLDFFFVRIWETLVKNTVKDFTRILLKWKEGIKGGGTLI